MQWYAIDTKTNLFSRAANWPELLHMSLFKHCSCFRVSPLSLKQSPNYHNKEMISFGFDMNVCHSSLLRPHPKYLNKTIVIKTSVKLGGYLFSALSVSATRFHRYSGYQAGSSPNPGANGWTAACVEQHLHLRGLQLHHHHRAQHEWEIHIPQTSGAVSDHGSDRSVPKQFMPLPCVCVCVCVRPCE